MSDEIKPALTPEEWAEVAAPATPITPDQGAISRLEQMLLDDPSAHGGAAALLHGQRFAFTWEDVDAIREVVNDDTWGGTAINQLADLADRIAALLPPREGVR